VKNGSYTSISAVKRMLDDHARLKQSGTGHNRVAQNPLDNTKCLKSNIQK